MFPRTWKNALLALLPLIVWATGSVAVADDRELKLKAAFVLNYIRYTTWPDKRGGELKVCYSGKGQFAEILEEVEGRVAAEYRLRILLLERSHYGSCDLVYVDAASENYDSSCIVSTALVVSDVCTEADIFMYAKEETLQFRVNLIAALKKGYRFSSKLLRVADEVIRD